MTRTQSNTSASNRQYRLFVTVGQSGADYITDGVADETQINQAITYVNSNGGGVVYCKDASYHVSNSPVTLKSNVWLRGNGRNLTTFYGDSTLGTNAVMLATAADSAHPISDLTLSDFTIDGTSMPTAPVSTFRKGIDALYTLRWLVQNVRIYHTPATGFGMDSNVQLQVVDCIADTCGTAGQNPGYNGFGFGVGWYADESTEVTNCIAINCLNNGFLLEYVGGGQVSRNYSFVNCHAIGNSRGYRLSGSSNVTFTNCHAYSNTNQGWYIQKFGAINSPCENIGIINCRAYSNGDSGIEFKVQDSVNINAVIEGTHSYSNTNFGIVTPGDHVNIKNCFVYSNTETGIYVDNNSGSAISAVQVTGNTVYNNGTAGTSGLNDGIRLRGELSAINGALIANNVCFDSQGTPTQNYGIALKDALTEILVKDNDCRNNVTGAVLKSITGAGTNITVTNVKGYNPKQFSAQGNVTGATTFNRVNGDTITATLTGNITVTLTSGVNPGDLLQLILTQDGTGSRTATWPANAKLAQGSLTLSTAASAVDVVTFKWDGTNWREVSRDLATSSSRIIPRVNSVASSATPSINTDTTDIFEITALAAAITSMTTNLTGTPNDGDKLVIRIKDNGTTRAITWGASFKNSGVATLLANTVVNKQHTVFLQWDAAASGWICLAVDAVGY